MFQLIYKSVRDSALNDDVFRQIAASSTARNTARGLSGVLLADETTLLQILEGEESVVRDVFGKITSDDRHFDVEILLERTISERNFENFGMGFYLSDDTDSSGYRMTLSALRAHSANRTRKLRLAS